MIESKRDARTDRREATETKAMLDNALTNLLGMLAGLVAGLDPQHLADSTKAQLSRTLPVIAQILPHASTCAPSMQAGLLHLLLQCLEWHDAADPHQTLHTTLRRIFEAVTRAPTSSPALQSAASRAGARGGYFESMEPRVRVASMLAAVRTASLGKRVR
jgi:hypothetical protein